MRFGSCRFRSQWGTTTLPVSQVLNVNCMCQISSCINRL
uniref:Uncharacterized protein n=1 Tax=Anguilla anguilla TaxID=7936 RepID=A0A0E9QPR9_ANGAN